MECIIDSLGQDFIGVYIDVVGIGGFKKFCQKVAHLKKKVGKKQ